MVSPMMPAKVTTAEMTTTKVTATEMTTVVVTTESENAELKSVVTAVGRRAVIAVGRLAVIVIIVIRGNGVITWSRGDADRVSIITVSMIGLGSPGPTEECQTSHHRTYH